MPLIVEGGRIPPRWAQEGACRNGGGACGTPTEHLNIALINNMPDAALEDTELQFFDLLDEASGDLPIYLKLYSLTGIPRTDRGQRHLNSFYYSLDELWQTQFDGVIVTGTEPRQPNLRDEPYWKVLADVFDWAERNTVSAILSCLAAHASVLHSDGIPRHRLPDKQFGVFDFAKEDGHPLLVGTAERVRFPHSRWNEVQADALKDSGYFVLTQSAEGGVDTFVKKKTQSLLVHFQGHPEYGAETLLKEYRRDIKRFLKQERETYPAMPKGYFDAAGERLVNKFREDLPTGHGSDNSEELMDAFPNDALARTLQRTWLSAAIAIYRNWLSYIVSKKTGVSKLSAVASVQENVQRKPIGLPQSQQGTCPK
ncbi:MAG: homoserine O-succinyltransferase [Terriglobales bacterium]|jgi:homoserine O-succinyltransferase